MKIALGADHAGYPLKAHLQGLLADLGHEVLDVGTDSEERCDYPVFGARAARAVAGGEADLGVIVCGSGVGISIAANKVDGVRCVVCTEPWSARMARRHNDANMLALGARAVGVDLAGMILEEFLAAEFEGGRHAGRVDLIGRVEAGEDL